MGVAKCKANVSWTCLVMYSFINQRTRKQKPSELLEIWLERLVCRGLSCCVGRHKTFRHVQCKAQYWGRYFYLKFLFWKLSISWCFGICDECSLLRSRKAFMQNPSKELSENICININVLLFLFLKINFFICFERSERVPRLRPQGLLSSREKPTHYRKKLNHFPGRMRPNGARAIM